jgi:hypothetical protein
MEEMGKSLAAAAAQELSEEGLQIRLPDRGVLEEIMAVAAVALLERARRANPVMEGLGALQAAAAADRRPMRGLRRGLEVRAVLGRAAEAEG